MKELSLFDFNERLQISSINMQPNEKKGVTSATNNNPSNSFSKLVPILRNVAISKLSWLKTLPMESFQQLTYLCINDENVESLGEIGEGVSMLLIFLAKLAIGKCRSSIGASHCLEGIPYRRLPSSKTRRREQA